VGEGEGRQHSAYTAGYDTTNPQSQRFTAPTTGSLRHCFDPPLSAGVIR
jgi:hypothetical protein